MTAMVDVDVAIVGAGPVGLTAALGLARRGVSVVVFERDHALGTFWRASTFHPPSLDVAAELGIVEQMLAAGLVAPDYQMRDYRAGVVARFDLGLLADETAWPFRLQLEQYKYSAIVERAVTAESSAEIRYGHTLASMNATDDGVELTFENGERVTAAWVIGADGTGSLVREQAEIDYEGDSYPLRRLLLSIDEPLDELVPGLDLVNYVYAPVGAGMVLRIPDLWRVMFTVPSDVDDVTAQSRRYYGSRMRELLGVDPDARTTQVYYIHQKLASTLRRGRVLIIGDAAHANSPTGGMGLNSGIQDAYDLVTTLTSAHGRSEAALDAWSARRRRAIAQEVHRVSRRNTVDLGESDDAARKRKQDEVRAIAADPNRAKEWLMESSMIASVRRHPIGASRVAPFTGAHAAAAFAGAAR